ncbi:hypothetical protein EUX98_g6401 [Antrodiella citrinella]|uniref:Reverse transcriptase domain-containing protein n=1 Tax=Antrodiella citrinella TaxID=2447956 RepID=A0A4S4MP80_9APHY|nr:hypothetical protein EUX98_g6401 [Antrodiella citrinella]
MSSSTDANPQPSSPEPPQQSAAAGQHERSPTAGSQPERPEPETRTNLLSDFERTTVEECEQLVSTFRQQKISKAEATVRLMQTLSVDDLIITNENHDARTEAFAVFLQQLDESSGQTAAGNVGGAPPSTPPGSAPSTPEGTAARKRERVGTIGDDEQEPKRKKQVNEALLPFLNQNSVPLSPELEETLRLKENYTRDIAQCKQLVLAQPCAPELPDVVWDPILKNSYVDLNKIFTGFYSTSGDARQSHKLGDLELYTEQIKTDRTITQHGHWTIAFTKYVEGVLFTYPHRAWELRTYGEYINNTFAAVRDGEQQKVINYERAVRTMVGRRNDLLLTDFSRFNHLYTMHVNSSGAGSSSGASQAQGGGRRPVNLNPGGTRTFSNEICKRWNAGKCGEARPTSSPTAPRDPLMSAGSERPRRFRGFLWNEAETPVTPSATLSESLRPIPGPPPEALRDAAAWNTINTHPDLFKFSCPVNVDRFESLLSSHPNRPLVDSVVRGLREGFWPFAQVDPNAPDLWDEPSYTVDPDALAFIADYAQKEELAGRYSAPFDFDLLPGMYSMPIHAVPKPHSDKLRLINNHSAGRYSLNSFISKDDVGMRPDNVQDLGRNLLFLRQEAGDVPLWLFKSDVSGAYRLIPMHPLWQLKQVVTIGGLRRIDHCMCFGSRGSPDIWCSFMSLVLWIAIRIKFIELLLAYMDDAFSFDTNMTLVHYPRYDSCLPEKQVRLLLLWDELGIPHDPAKQLFGRTLTIIGYHVDPINMTISLPLESSQALVAAVRAFLDDCDSHRRQPLRHWQKLIGWINWGLNVQPLARPALQSSYAKIQGKQHAHAGVSINRAVRRDLEWVAALFARHDGVHVLTSRCWTPFQAELTIYCDASLDGMGFWCPQRLQGFAADNPPCPSSVPAESNIFWYEALTVLSALQWAAELPVPPKRLAIFTDNLNTVQMFDSFRAMAGYNDILLSACTLLIKHHIDLRVWHIPGVSNTVADALSHRLIQARAVALGHAIDNSTRESYTSHLQSYLTFCKLHNFPIEPSPDTLSFYTVYMCHHIKPDSVDSYLSGICNQLEHLWPNVREIRRGHLVARSLAGCKRMLGTPARRKEPLEPTHLIYLLDRFPPNSHDNLLFRALLLSGFFALHRLGELVWPDKLALRSWRKVILRSSVTLYNTGYGYLLPTSKTDAIFEGATIIIDSSHTQINTFDPHACFLAYLTSRDSHFSFQPALWLTASGSIPTRAWFLARLRVLRDMGGNLNVGGHSLRSGGATHFAVQGWPDDRIQALGRWSSDAFKIYIRKNPVVLQALLHNRSLVRL